MFVLVVDTSLMNVSISAVVQDLDTTVSGVQSAIALEALVSAAFILISSKVGDLIGRKRAYVLGLLGYAVGALAMTLAQSLTAIIIFWAIIGGLGASLLLPAMQSLIHGNFEGAARKKAYALVGASAAIAAAVGPLLGGFVTTYLSWRVGFLLEVVIIAVVLSRDQARPATCRTPARARSTWSVRSLSVIGMGGVVLGILVWQEGGEYVGAARSRSARSALALLAWWLVRRKRRARSRCSTPSCSGSRTSGSGSPQQMLQQITLGRRDDRAADLPADDARVQRDGGRPVARAALAQHVRRRDARRPAGREAAPGDIVRVGFALTTIGIAGDRPARARAPTPAGALVVPLIDRRMGARAAGLAAQQLHAVADRGGAGQRGGRRELRRRIVRAVVRARDGRRHHARRPLVLVHPPDREQHRHPPAAAAADRGHARGRRQVMSNTQLDALLVDEPPAVQAEILRINTDARNRSLQVALLGADPRRAPRALQRLPHAAPPGSRRGQDQVEASLLG